MDCLTVTRNQTLIAIFYVGIEVEEILKIQNIKSTKKNFVNVGYS